MYSLDVISGYNIKMGWKTHLQDEAYIRIVMESIKNQ